MSRRDRAIRRIISAIELGAAIVQILVNGETREIATALTIGELIRLYELTPQRVAVEVNRELVRRARFDDVRVADGDEVEIVTLVGGG